MRKLKRKKILRDHLENQLYKCERRIQKIAEQAYHIRQAIATIDVQEAERNKSKGEVDRNVIEAAVQTRI